jgi:hypothetical protein
MKTTLLRWAIFYCPSFSQTSKRMGIEFLHRAAKSWQCHHAVVLTNEPEEKPDKKLPTAVCAEVMSPVLSAEPMSLSSVVKDVLVEEELLDEELLDEELLEPSIRLLRAS